MNSFSKKTKERLKGLELDLILWTSVFIATCPIDVYLNEGIRSTEDQLKAFKNGYSKLDGINKKSKHQVGRAVDIYYVGWKSSDSDNDNRWTIIRHHAEEVDRITGISMTHGYDWGWDKPHHELRG